MSFRLKLLPTAVADVAEARDWYEKRRDGLGTEYIVEVDAALAIVAGDPQRRPAEFREARRAQLKRFPYVVYYRIAGEIVEVFAILHSKRNPRTWRSRAKQ